MPGQNQTNPGLEAAVITVPVVSNLRRWLIVGLLFMSSAINYLDRATISVAIPIIAVELNLGPSEKGLLLWAFFASYALMQFPIGVIVDRVDLKWLYAIMFSIWSVSCGLTGVADSLVALIAIRACLGVGESIYLPGDSKIVSLLFTTKERGLPSGVFDSGTRAGLALGAPLVAWLIVRHGWRMMFFIVGFIALAWLVPWLIIFPARLHKIAAPGAATDSAVMPKPRRLLTFNRNLLGLSIGFFCFGYYWYLFVTWLPDYLVKVRHLSLLKAGIYAALPYMVFGVSEAVGGWIADRLVHLGWDETRARKWMVTVGFMMGLMLIPAALVASAQAAILLVAGAALVGLASGNLLAIIQCCAPEDEIGTWAGTQNFIGNLGGISALVTGLLISWTGSYLPAFVLAVAVLLTGLLSYWFIVGELKAGSY